MELPAGVDQFDILKEDVVEDLKVMKKFNESILNSFGTNLRKDVDELLVRMPVLFTFKTNLGIAQIDEGIKELFTTKLIVYVLKFNKLNKFNYETMANISKLLGISAADTVGASKDLINNDSELADMQLVLDVLFQKEYKKFFKDTLLVYGNYFTLFSKVNTELKIMVREEYHEDSLLKFHDKMKAFLREALVTLDTDKFKE
jgi:hypothetical protein